MKTLEELIRHYYTDLNYNCAETIVHAANDRYGLNITDEDMKMMGGFSAGMYEGIVCGALSGCVAVLSKMIVRRTAREERETVRPVILKMVENFREHLGGENCRELRPKYHDPQNACLKTVLLAGEALEMTIKEMVTKETDR